ncbi:hypothetical protein H310_03684 [Aphanomyces invadans]|uniref:Uncharacterized protein n=1 Tax=Aphanomyces invadans TaxID=157072 RepID=A0A024UIS3_9STRA|nr:hypothetical protein H310_03684 [Aphanomyces invadans]ETW06090.1 hypothetical protein H310_03684 [Aphanomyces invadans]|eukprot:XP_008865867.1 hypothetical protein H310_03684 [Aphanomyces invadans]
MTMAVSTHSWQAKFGRPSQLLRSDCANSNIAPNVHVKVLECAAEWKIYQVHDPDIVENTRPNFPATDASDNVALIRCLLNSFLLPGSSSSTPTSLKRVPIPSRTALYFRLPQGTALFQMTSSAGAMARHPPGTRALAATSMWQLSFHGDLVHLYALLLDHE